MEATLLVFSIRYSVIGNRCSVFGIRFSVFGESDSRINGLNLTFVKLKKLITEYRLPDYHFFYFQKK